MKKNIFTSATLALVALGAWAQEKNPDKVTVLEEVVVSDTKFAQSKEKSGKVIIKISAEELKKKSGQTLATVLNSVAGVEINSNQSVAGKNLGYYIRGGKNQQVLITIDGNPVTDASMVGFQYDLRLIPVDQIESIEIMKGAASTLYGTGAATAVINITLKKSSNTPFQINAYYNVGTNNTAQDSKITGKDSNQGIAFSGKIKKVTYFSAINSSESGGMSEIVQPQNEIYDKDTFSRYNLLGKLGFQATKNLHLDFFGTLDRIKQDYDFPFDNTGFDDTDKNKSETQQFRFGFSPKYNYKNGEIKLNSNYSNIERNYQDWDNWNNELTFTNYFSRNVNLDLVNKYNFSKEIALVTGLNYQFYDMAQESVWGDIEKQVTKFITLDPYFTAVYTSNFGLNLNIGGRLNHHSAYGNHVVFNFNPSYNITKGIKFLGSVSTAYVSPSLYQLYSQYGNKDLTPQKNLTAETGVEINLFNKKLLFSTVAFFREENNSIGFLSTYYNIDGKNKAKGLENSVSYKVSEKINLSGNYTFTQVDEALNRLIPKHKANIAVDFYPTKRLYFNATYQYTDKRTDAFFDGNTWQTLAVNLDSYKLCNALAKYELIENQLSVFVSATNIFNENFVENIGYSTRGRNFRIGFNLNL